jgi:hypothetical protein
MKHLSVLLATLFLFAATADAQESTTSAFSAKTYYKASTVEDTSSTITLGSYPNVWFHTTTTGADSTVMYQNFDAYINSNWVNNILRDTLTLGRPTGYINGTLSKGQIDYRQLRSPSVDLLGGASAIRIRNKHASGAGDSTSALTYTMKVIRRKP